MVEWQIICKVLDTQDYSLIEDNDITEEYFAGTGYEEEFRFIKEHYEKYGNVPDKATFLSKFREVEFVEVNESDDYLIDTIREQNQFKKLVPIVEKIVELADTDANVASEYMLKAVQQLQPQYKFGGTDLIADADQRLEHYKERVNNQDSWYFSTGFHELDLILHGIQRFEEFVVLFARLGQGKSWVLAKMITHIWKLGFNVCYISPEMGPDSVGYRFDTIRSGYSNRDLMWGLPGIDIEQYEQDIAELKTRKNKFIVSTPSNFGNKITVSKLRNFVKQNHLDILAIDGIKYLADERYRKGDNLTTTLTNISEDLIKLSVELQIPVIVVVQANREGAGEEVPNIENIRDSDGIAQNATKVIALRQEDGNLEMLVEKNRYGTTGKKLKYIWNINDGEFIYTQSDENSTKEEVQERREKKKASGKDIF